jgi:hypothetical protein
LYSFVTTAILYKPQDTTYISVCVCVCVCDCAFDLKLLNSQHYIHTNTEGVGEEDEYTIYVAPYPTTQEEGPS